MLDNLQLSAAEQKMLEEVFAVFEKYTGDARTFGVQLVHTHFPISSDEILYETHDPIKRILKTKAVKITEFKEPPLATAWHKNHTGKIVISQFCCDRPEGGTDDE
jgi:hypothetical protein